MVLMYAIGTVMVLGLSVYLLWALLKPEAFE